MTERDEYHTQFLGIYEKAQELTEHAHKLGWGSRTEVESGNIAPYGREKRTIRITISRQGPPTMEATDHEPK